MLPKRDAGPALPKDSSGGDRDSSSALMTSSSAPTLTSGIDGLQETSLCHPGCHKADEQWGQTFHAHNFGVGSPTPVPTGLTLFCYPGKGQGQLSRVLQLVWGQSAPSPTKGGMVKGGEHLSLTLTTTWQMSGVWPDILLSHTHSYSPGHSSVNRVISVVLRRQ